MPFSNNFSGPPFYCATPLLAIFNNFSGPPFYSATPFIRHSRVVGEKKWIEQFQINTKKNLIFNIQTKKAYIHNKSFTRNPIISPTIRAICLSNSNRWLVPIFCRLYNTTLTYLRCDELLHISAIRISSYIYKLFSVVLNKIL